MIPICLNKELQRAIKITDRQSRLDYVLGWRDDLSTDVYAIDTETTGVNPRSDRCVSISISDRPERALMCKVEDLPKDVRQASRVVVHNKAFDDPVLKGIGLNLNITDDTMIQAYVLGKERLGLKWLSKHELDQEMQGIDDLILGGKITMADVPDDLALPYGGSDADQTLQLFHHFSHQLDQEPELKRIYDLEMSVLPMIIRMSDVGARVDPSKFKTLSRDIAIEINRVKAEIFDEVGAFNIDSPQQVSKLLFDQLGIEPLRSTNTPGQFVTDADTLRDLSHEHPIIDPLLEYRQYKTLQGTFVDKLPQLINPKTGRIHPQWLQWVVVTGRLSSKAPNLMNIPVRGRIGNKIREAFIPNPGNVFVGFDFSGIEVRVLAHLSQDSKLCQMIVDDVDPHYWTASFIFGIPIDEVPKSLRDIAKTCLFAVVYLVSPFTLAKTLRKSLTSDEARELCQRRGVQVKGDVFISLAKAVIEGIYKAYPEVTKWQQEVIAEAARVGYTRSYLGRRRKLMYLQHPNAKARAADERIAVNHWCQATASGDLMKSTMAEIWKVFGHYDWFMPDLQIHDEMQLEVPEEKAEEVEWAVQEIAPNALPLSVPIAIETKVGKTWAETH